MGRVQKTGVLLLMFFITVLLLHEVIHLDRYGHLVRFGLHADLVVSKGANGLEGITKLYEARLTNYGLLPAKVTACDFTTDASAHGTKVAYTVEQWDSRQNKWKPVVEFGDEPPFCLHYAGGNISEARLFLAPLWPGQSIATDKEATGKAGDWRNAFPTPAFRIDEQELPMYALFGMSLYLTRLPDL
jgi:hypothetical protein